MNYRNFVQIALKYLKIGIYRWPSPYKVQGHLHRLFPKLGVDCVLDVGANRGQFALSLRESGFRGWIISFEPNQALIPGLRALAEKDGRWHVIAIALGDVDDHQMLNVTNSDDFSSFLDAKQYSIDNFGYNAVVSRTEKTHIMRLDDIFQSIKSEFGFKKPFLKMDTQGYDLNVLKGSEICIRDIVGLITEISIKPIYDNMPDATESLITIRNLGFDVTGLFQVSSDRKGATVEIDCVAQRSDMVNA